jgi:hypothetical protein
MVALIVCLSASISTAAGQVTTPPPGSPLRAAILDALRPAIEAEIGPPVEFKVSTIHVWREWAYVAARPQRRGGQPIDWRRTKYREAFENDAMSDLVLGLMRRSGSGWQRVGYFIGPTDAAWEEWATKYRLPRELFYE